MLTPKQIIEGLKPCHYRYNNEKELGDKINFGFIAQDILEAFGEDYNFVKKDSDGKFYQVHYYQFLAPLVSYVKSQQEEIEFLKNEIKELKEKI